MEEFFEAWIETIFERVSRHSGRPTARSSPTRDGFSDSSESALRVKIWQLATASRDAAMTGVFKASDRFFCRSGWFAFAGVSEERASSCLTRFGSGRASELR